MLFHLCLLAAFGAAGAVRSDAVEALAASRRSQRRIISVADLHGDFDTAKSILAQLGLISEDGAWTGGDTVLIQMGDMADRGSKSKQIYDLFFNLQEEAPKQGGQVLTLLGNHEMMLMEGDDRYLSDEDAAAWGGREEARKAFDPATGKLGLKLMATPLIHRLGKEYGLAQPLVFVHAGLTGTLAKAMRDTVADMWNDIPDVGDRVVEAVNKIKFSSSKLVGTGGLLWTRELSEGEDICEDLDTALNSLNAARMVVGHTIQDNTMVNERCGGKLLLSDTAISEAIDGGKPHPSAVEYTSDGCAKAMYFGRAEDKELTCVTGVPQEA